MLTRKENKLLPTHQQYIICAGSKKFVPNFGKKALFTLTIALSPTEYEKAIRSDLLHHLTD